MIAHGHRWPDVRAYTLPQALVFWRECQRMDAVALQNAVLAARSPYLSESASRNLARVLSQATKH